MAKPFETDIGDHSFSFARNAKTIAEQAKLDHIYVVRTSLAAEQADAATTVPPTRASPRSGAPSAHEDHGSGPAPGVPLDGSTCAGARAAVHAGLLPRWPMRQKLAPLLFDDHDRPAAGTRHTSPVAKAEPSPAARRKAASKRTGPLGGVVLPMHGSDLFDDLATLTRDVICSAARNSAS